MIMDVLLTTEKVCIESYIKTVVFKLQMFTWYRIVLQVAFKTEEV